jgi:hypothetical protein
MRLNTRIYTLKYLIYVLKYSNLDTNILKSIY